MCSCYWLVYYFGTPWYGHSDKPFFAPRVAAVLFGLPAISYIAFAVSGAEVAVFAAVAMKLCL
ncbi:MAG: hypothetical protein ACJAVO_002759 [Parvibaculaceae bacterium]|jgi:hypothetical protein